MAEKQKRPFRTGPDGEVILPGFFDDRCSVVALDGTRQATATKGQIRHMPGESRELPPSFYSPGPPLRDDKGEIIPGAVPDDGSTPIKEGAPEVAETDGTFFDDLRKMERDLLTRAGDTEGLTALDEEERRVAEEMAKADALNQNAG